MKEHNHKSKEQLQSSHSAHAVSTTKKGLLFSLILTASFFVIELIVGFRINSVAVIADAAHNFSAAAGIAIALVATVLVSRPISQHRTFGFFKVEMFAAWINGALLLGMAYMIVKKGIVNLLNPTEVAVLPMIVLAFIGLIIGGIPAIMLYKKQKTDINARGAFWHVMETVFGSAAVLIAAVIMYFTGWVQADAVFGMMLAPVLVIASWGILKESTRSLLDLTPKNLNLLEIKKEIGKIKGVSDIHHVHAWNITTGKNIFSAHVQVNDISKSQIILKKIHKMLKKKYGFYFSTIQIEREGNYHEEAEEINIFKRIK